MLSTFQVPAKPSNHFIEEEHNPITSTKLLDSLKKARSCLESSEPLEVVALELQEACAALDEIVGKVYNDEVLNRIFGEFCIGK